ncbi:MAG: hypothetical protein OEZ13_02920 [Spirochaetia bacterium]|nr:hypothetical protein [Spirochaetia bacterium]
MIYIKNNSVFSAAHNKLAVLLFLFFFIVPLNAYENQAEIDENLKNLSLSGFLRTRIWHFQSKTAIGDFPATSEQKKVTYQDLFFRNRLSLKVNESTEIHSVFDIFTVFGLDSSDSVETMGGSIGKAGFNLKTRNVYFLLKPNSNFETKIGLMPFSLPGGHIIATDGAGIRFRYDFFKGLLRTYFSWMKAYDNSKEDLGKGFGGNNYNDNDIYIAGGKIKVSEDIKTEFYYTYEKDMDSLKEPDTGRLHWAGIRQEIFSGKLFADFNLIYNWGRTNKNASENMFVNAGLWDILLGLQLKSVEISLLQKGATGSPNDLKAEKSFQSIRPSHGFSFIFIDNNGGISFSGGAMHGIYGQGLNIKFSIISGLSAELKYVHYRTIRKVISFDAQKDSYLGDEANFYVKYELYENTKLFSSLAVFLPQKAYTFYSQSANKRPVYEFLLGGRVDY